MPLGEHSVTVTSANDCVFVLDFEVEDFVDIYNIPPYYVPNVFSPNYDGINDYFALYGKTDEIESIRSMRIFGRWGELLFERTDFLPNDETLGWDGKFRGRLMQNGVYVYVIEVLLEDGEIDMVQGDVLLLK